MKNSIMLTVASLLSIILFSLHVTDDIVRGFEGGGISNLVVVLIIVIWLYGTVALAGRLSGYVIVLLLSLVALLVPVLHMEGNGLGLIGGSPGGFFFIWTIIALGATSLFSVALALRGLWSMARRRAP